MQEIKEKGMDAIKIVDEMRSELFQEMGMLSTEYGELLIGGENKDEDKIYETVSKMDIVNAKLHVLFELKMKLNEN